MFKQTIAIAMVLLGTVPFPLFSQEPVTQQQGVDNQIIRHLALEPLPDAKAGSVLKFVLKNRSNHVVRIYPPALLSPEFAYEISFPGGGQGRTHRMLGDTDDDDSTLARQESAAAITLNPGSRYVFGLSREQLIKQLEPQAKKLISLHGNLLTMTFYFDHVLVGYDRHLLDERLFKTELVSKPISLN